MWRSLEDTSHTAHQCVIIGAGHIQGKLESALGTALCGNNRALCTRARTHTSQLVQVLTSSQSHSDSLLYFSIFGHVSGIILRVHAADVAQKTYSVAQLAGGRTKHTRDDVPGTRRKLRCCFRG